jgi:hypothetical protein
MPPSFASIARTPVRAVSAIEMLQNDYDCSAGWGEMACEGDLLTMPAVAKVTPTPAPVLRADWEHFYAQPWARNVQWLGSDYLDLSALTEDEYVALMTWVYANGWYVPCDTSTGTCEECYAKTEKKDCPHFTGTGKPDESRFHVMCQPDMGPSRAWVRPNRFEIAAQLMTMPVATPAPVALPKKVKLAVIPRFCVKCAAAGSPEGLPGCKYSHEDTIPRVNEPCKFGDGCGSGDPAKRATCIRMHPGEVWSEDLVICRPVTETPMMGGGGSM